MNIQTNLDGVKDRHFISIENGEWLEYPLQVDKAGEYDVKLRVAAIAGKGKFNVEIVTEAQSFFVSAELNGALLSWVTNSVSVGYLPKGEIRLRIQVSSNGFNLNWIELEEVCSSKG